MANQTALLHSFESFGTVDGPGIRFVVFFQGCPMRCIYCHNPDTWATNKDAKQYTVAEVMEKIKKNRPFYRSGGITATGGEPLLQIGFLTELFSAAKAEGFHTCLDTSGITFDKSSEAKLLDFGKLLDVCDLVMLDIKHMNDKEHKKLTGHGNGNILDFAKFVDSRNIPLRIRQVIVPGITDTDEQLTALGEFVSVLKSFEKLELLPYHDMGRVKYEALGLPYPLCDTPVATKDDIARAYDFVKSSGAKI